jgi:S-adenosylmethionine:tRNA ribosyltransferase-isomerase
MSDLLVSDFDFDLPPELIAQQPPAERGQSRLLAVDRATGAVADRAFADFPSLLQPGDLLVLNDTRVIPARLYAKRTTVRDRQEPTALVEVFLTEQVKPEAHPVRCALPNPCHPEPQICHPERSAAESKDLHLGIGERSAAQSNDPRLEVVAERTRDHQPAPSENLWRALVKPGKKVAVGEHLAFPDSNGQIMLEAEVLDRGEFGERLLRFAPVPNFYAALDRIGHMPLPPYIHRDDAQADRERYQTVFNRERGSVAAPTAGLHFTPEILAEIQKRGVEIARVTLHVGLGTFAPLRVERLDEVRLHRERYTLTAETAAALNSAKSEGRRVVAVGTTVVRTLEHCGLLAAGKQLEAHSGETEIFISPGFEFKLVDGLLTNFHLPKSSLLMLVSAFAGREPVLAAYRHAVEQKYRFFSYGDCMFLS